jgi:hypothetical protein
MVACRRVETRRARTTHAGSLMLFAVLASLPSCRGGERATAPNVVLVSIDCLNQRQFEEAVHAGAAPTLTALLDESVSFSRGYTHAPWTTPSHMSMLTGLYPHQHARDIPYGLMFKTKQHYNRVPGFKTAAEHLAGAGYEPVAFVGKGSISAPFGIAQGFRLFHESAKNPPSQSDLPLTFEVFRGWLEKRRAGPFFLFLHTYDLHTPVAKVAPREGLRSDLQVIAYIDGYPGEGAGRAEGWRPL